MIRKRTFATTFLLTAALLAGCGDSEITGVGYEPLVGTWAAVAFDGEPFPITQTITPGTVTCEVETVSVHLEFTIQGRYTNADVTTLQCGDDPPTDISEPVAGTYRVVGDRLYLRETGRAEGSTLFSISGDTLTVFLFNAAGTPIPLELVRQ